MPVVASVPGSVRALAPVSAPVSALESVRVLVPGLAQVSVQVAASVQPKMFCTDWLSTVTFPAN